MGLIIFLPILGIILIVLICSIASSNEFREHSKQIKNGMTKQEVLSIMGEPSYTKAHQNGSCEYIYEKSEWKGFLRGGTKIRRMEIVFSTDDIVISVGKNQNCDMTGW